MDFDPSNIIKEIDVQYEKLNVSEMENYLISTITLASNQYGENSPGFAALLNELGGFYRTASQYDKAEQVFNKAKDIFERSVGQNDPNYATTINNLAGLYRLTGDYSKSEALFLRAIEIYKNTSYQGSFPHSSALNNLGLLYQEMQRYDDAARLHEEAFEMAKKTSSDPIVTATSMSNLASAYMGMKRFNEAEKLLKEAVEIYRKSMSQSDPHYASALNNLGLFYFASKDYKSAEALFLEALQLREQVFGRNHHEFAMASDNLSILYNETGDLPLAEHFARQSCEAYLHVFGVDHPSYKNSLLELQKLQDMLNDKNQPARSTVQTNLKEDPDIKGISLSLQYFNQFGVLMMSNQFAEYQSRIAVGLVGEGSECFGFDDEFSRDHDWGPSFCLWLTKEDYEKIGAKLQLEYNKLPQNFLGYEIKNQSDLSSGRRGVFEINSFYKKYIGLDRPPVTIREWKAIPEINLSLVTNGQIFSDTLGEFTSFREKLKGFYPEDVRLKKISARCAAMAQTGQYNYSRCIKRSEYVAAHYALSQFVEAGISMIFLLNKEYKPFYKWMHKALKALPILGAQCYDIFSELAAEKNNSKEAIFEKRIELIEKICRLVINELAQQGLSYCTSDFLLDHAFAVQGHIQDPDLRLVHVMTE